MKFREVGNQRSLARKSAVGEYTPGFSGGLWSPSAQGTLLLAFSHLGMRWSQSLFAQVRSDSDTCILPGDLGMPVCAKPSPAQPPGRRGERASFRNLRIYALHTSILPLPGLKSEMWAFL